MQIAVFSGDPATAAVDLAVLGVPGDKAGSTIKTFDTALDGALAAAVKDENFKGSDGQTLVLNTLGKIRAKRVALVGMGENPADERSLLELGGHAAKLGNKVGAKSVVLVLPKVDAPSEVVAELVSRGAFLGAYRFDRYLSDKGRKATVAKVQIDFSAIGKAGTVEKNAIKRGLATAEGVALARDLVNMPPADLYPESFAKIATTEAKRLGLTVKVFDVPALKRMKMGMLMAVGQGSSRPPRLVHITYTPKGATAKTPSVALVGKGVTFDSGGLSLKPSASMVDMKIDMGGAASVMGAMVAIGKLKPKVKVHAICTLAENMPGGNAYKLGDVLTAASGRTVEINNTDAEGRLCLGDALHYACQQKPDQIIDMATLTGAIVVALGPYTVGLYSNDDGMADKLLASSKRTGESFWKMPLNTRLKEQMKSEIADTKNTGGREGGSITAALFLSEFIGDTTWAHLDIAGPASSDSESGSVSKGGTGVAVATLVDYLSS